MHSYTHKCFACLALLIVICWADISTNSCSSNQDPCTCSSVSPFPYSSLGEVYEVVTWSPVGRLSSNAQASFTIAAQFDGSTPTTVHVRFPPVPSGASISAAQCNIQFMSSVYLHCGDVVQMTLIGSETATFFTSNVDLSGTMVEASDPVAVYAKNTNAMIGPAVNVYASTASQLFPVTAWGRRHAVAPVPDNTNSGYSISVTSGQLDDVSLTVATAATTKNYFLQRHRPLTLEFYNNEAAYLVSSSPVQVVQFTHGATVATDFGSPASLAVPAVEQFVTFYEFVIPSDKDYFHYVTFVIQSASRYGILINGILLDPYGRRPWAKVDENSGLVTNAVLLLETGLIQIGHQLNHVFGAYRYSYIRRNCAFAYPAGAPIPLPPPVTVTPSVPSTSSSTPSSTSTTPNRPTEPSFVLCPMNNMGTEFALTFIENEDESSTNHLQVYPASFSRLPTVEVTIEIPSNSTVGLWNESFQMSTSSSKLPVIVEVPRQVEMIGIGVWKNAVVVRSSVAIGLYGMNVNDKGSCDGFMALPVESFGFVYYAICYYPTSYQSEIGIVAVHDNTVVNVTLKSDTRPSIVIVWNGVSYRSSDTNPVITKKKKVPTATLR